MQPSALRSPYRSHAYQYRAPRAQPLSLGPRLGPALLLRLSPNSGAEPQLLAQARELALGVPAPVRLQVCVSLDGARAYVYAWMEAGALPHERVEGSHPKRLELLSEWKGASYGGDAPFHYIVATDVEPGWENEFNEWYDIEHMPGLAAVPGTVRCARLKSLDGRPKYHACYDLLSPAAMERDEWLAIRHTPWASRVRPHFVNTRRIMFRTLLDERRAGVQGAYF
jgi:hypothetical protein